MILTPPRTLADLAKANAATPGARLVFGQREANFQDLDEAAHRVAAGLAAAGLAHGDRLAIWLDNRWPWLVALFACARLGAIAVAVNTKFRSKELGDILVRSGATHLLLSLDAPGAVDVLRQCDSLGQLKVVIDAADTAIDLGQSLESLSLVRYSTLEASLPDPSNRGSQDDGIVIFTTSGTTNAPKFVLHDQRRVIQHGYDLARAAALDERSVMLLAPPFCGTFGFSATFCALASRARLIIPALWDPLQALQLIQEHKVTHCMLTDDAMHRLLAASVAPLPMPDMHLAGVAGVNPRLDGIYADAQARGVTLAGLYGSSELQAIVSIQDAGSPLAQRAKRGGRLVSANAKVRACDPHTGNLLAHGEPGELEFFVPDSGMKEYFGNPTATADAFRPDGYFRSGDLGFTESDGSFVFLARMGDSLRLGGFLVDPTEIELVLQLHPAVREAQVVAVETDRGNRPIAFLILECGAVLEEEDLKACVAERLAKFKVPIGFHVMEDFPRTVSANATKVQKSKLKQLAQELRLGHEAPKKH